VFGVHQQLSAGFIARNAVLYYYRYNIKSSISSHT
jgi:hypothetical protein